MKILILPSVNLEFYLYTNREIGNGYAKIPVDSYNVSIGGSSLNICMALKAGGYDPTLFAFAGHDNQDGMRDLFLHHLNILSVTNKVFPILEKTSVAFIDRSEGYPDTIRGYRSPFYNGFDLIDEIEKIRDQYDLKIGSGVSEKEIGLINSIFTEESINLLIPKKDVLEKFGKDLKLSFPNAHILCIDQNELEMTGVRDPCDFGFDLVTVTNEGKQGFFCFHEKVGMIMPKMLPKNKQIYPTGAGDWFAGSLCAFLDRYRINVRDKSTPMAEVQKAIASATSVASEKILFPTAILGPNQY